MEYSVRSPRVYEFPLEFFYNPQAKTYTKWMIYYMLARWGYSPNISHIQLWNDIDSVLYFDNPSNEITSGQIVDWLNFIKGIFRQYDLNQHLLTNLTGAISSMDDFVSSQMDTYCREYYLINQWIVDIDLPLNIDAFVNYYANTIESYYHVPKIKDRPLQLSAMGLSGDNPSDDVLQMNYLLYDTIVAWTSLFRWTFPGNPFYWEGYHFFFQKYYHHMLGTMRKFVVDNHLDSIESDYQNIEIYISTKDKYDCINSATYSASYPIGPDYLSYTQMADSNYGSYINPMNKYQGIDPTYSTAGRILYTTGFPQSAAAGNLISSANTHQFQFIVDTEEDTIMTFYVDVGVDPDNLNALLQFYGDWKSIQNITMTSAGTIDIDVPAGTHNLTVLNNGPTTASIILIKTTNYCYGLGSLAKVKKDGLVAWIYKRSSVPDECISGLIKLPRLEAGHYKVIWTNILTGKRIKDKLHIKGDEHAKLKTPHIKEYMALSIHKGGNSY